MARSGRKVASLRFPGPALNFPEHMKQQWPALQKALLLVLGCIGFRLLSSLFPDVIPDISPLMAVAFVGAMYLPVRWGWLVGPSTLLITELAFLKINYVSEGAMFSWWTPISLLFYMLVGGLGVLLARHKSLGKIAAGSVLCSTLFYVSANTYSWAIYLQPTSNPGYPFSLAGWWQANTVGLPGWVPTWVFLRNGISGDLFFAFLLLLILDRGLLFAGRSASVLSRAA